MALELMDYVKIVGSSALVGSAAGTTGAFISGFFTWRKDRREHKRERFLAALVAVETLEDFARGCV